MDQSSTNQRVRRVALVTGSARGIGRAIALRLADQGRAVVVADLLDEPARETAAIIREAGGEAVHCHIDVTDSASVENGIKQAREQLGEIDILVNNAGWDEYVPFIKTDESFWRKVVEINYLGALRVTRAIVPGMIERGWGRVVNLGSDAGRVGSSLEAVYSGAKGGIIAFTKALAREVARQGITANTVCPGPTETPLLKQLMASTGDAEKVVAAMTRAVPMKRTGLPEEVAVAVAFFASDEATYITGQTLSVSGGLTMA